MVSEPSPPPREQGSRKIQLPYINKFETLWEYRKCFLSGQIDFSPSIGAVCPICHRPECYRKITPYWRHAIELFPEFMKEKIPIARFLCRSRKTTFSLLPIQLIPYFQYTVSAVIGTLLLVFQCRRMGQQGFHGASVGVDPESLVTPWLIVCWLRIVLQGLRRGHRVLMGFYDLGEIRSQQHRPPWEEMAGYFLAFALRPQAPPGHIEEVIERVLYRYSRSTARFLFGIPSQSRLPRNRPRRL
jgi:hypothetical protein